MQRLEEHVLRELRDRLEREATRINKRIRELIKQDPFNDPDRVNDNAASDTEASEGEGHDRMSALVDALKKEQAGIAEALARMEAGTYGVCRNCGRKIPMERLFILPTTPFCLDCERREQ